jgi:HlyD family secretion protein
VPNGAIFRRGEQWHTYVVIGDRAELRSVKVGRASTTETEILEGVKDGDEVILYPGDRIKDGLRVRTVKM